MACVRAFIRTTIQQEKAMNTTKKLICILTAGVTLGAAAPVFADSWRDRGYERNRHSYRDHDRHGYRDYDRHRVVVVQRPYVVERAYVVERPVYYSEPAPVANIGLGAMIGAAIGGYIDSRQ
jgi:hypothetical protein